MQPSSMLRNIIRDSSHSIQTKRAHNNTTRSICIQITSATKYKLSSAFQPFIISLNFTKTFEIRHFETSFNPVTNKMDRPTHSKCVHTMSAINQRISSTSENSIPILQTFEIQRILISFNRRTDKNPKQLHQKLLVWYTSINENGREYLYDV